MSTKEAPRRPRIIPPCYLCWILFSFFLLAAQISQPCQASEATEIDDGLTITEDSDNDDDDEYIDLDDLTNEQLEDVCNSRGFELVREVDPDTGEMMEYTHQDFVDAASECLQIEADLEEILQKHPEILEDVKKESERMMHERDRLQEQLNQLQKEQQEGTSNGNSGSDSSTLWGVGETQQHEQQLQSNTDVSGGDQDKEENNVDIISSATVEQQTNNTTETLTQENSDNGISDDQPTPDSVTSTASTTKPSKTKTEHKPIFTTKEIILEVCQQIKSDFSKVINIIAPEPLRRQIQPALKTFVKVTKDTGMEVYDFIKRYARAFLNGQGVGRRTGESGENVGNGENRENADSENSSASASTGVKSDSLKEDSQSGEGN